MRGDTPAKLVIDVLKECVATFGPATNAQDTAMQAAWVKRRVEQLLRHPQAPGFDAKAARAGRDA